MQPATSVLLISTDRDSAATLSRLWASSKMMMLSFHRISYGLRLSASMR